MISGIGCQASQQMPIFLNSEALKFQGRLVSSLVDSLQVARIMEIAKLITLLAALVLLSGAAITVFATWLLPHGQSPRTSNLPNQGSGNASPLLQTYHPIKTSSNTFSNLQNQKMDNKPLKTQQGTISASSITPFSLPSTLPSLSKMPISAIGPVKQFQVSPFAVQSFSLIPLQAQTHYVLPVIQPEHKMNRMFGKSVTSLRQYFQESIFEIKSLEDQINLQAKTPFPNSISYGAFLFQNSDVLDLFVQGDVQRYEQAANQLCEYLDSLLHYHGGPNPSLSSILGDPIRKAETDIHTNYLSRIFAALSEKQFNQGKAMDCFSSAKKIRFNTVMQDSILRSLIKNFICQGNFDEAIDVLDECSNTKVREDWKLYIAKTLFNQNNSDGKGLKVAEGMKFSDEKNAFIFNIAKLQFLSLDLDQAFITAKASFSDESGQVFQAIAKTHFNNGNLDKAYEIRGWLSSDERKEIVQAIAKTYFNNGNLDKAYDTANGLSDDDKKEIFQAIAKKYILDGKLDEAKDFARWLSGSEKTEILEACAETHYSLGNIKKMCEAARAMHSSDEKQFFINAISAFLHQGKLGEAEQVADEMSHLFYDEKDSAYCDIALAYYRAGNYQEAISIANKMSYGKERDSIVEQMEQRAKI